MAGFREQFIQATQFVSPLIPLKLLIKRFTSVPLLPVYHTVSDKTLPHIHNLYAVKTINSFKKDLDFLLKNFNPISYLDFQESVLAGEKLKSNSFLLTFDDGLSEFYDVISPILLEKGIPAICFLNSDFIDNKELFYRYKVSLLIEELKINPNKSQLTEVKTWNTTHFDSQNTRINLLKTNFNSRYILDELATNLDVDFQGYLENEKPYLDSIQIKELINKGFHFGSHSCNHPEYQSIPILEQLEQTEASTDQIQKRFNLSYRTFAFPFTDYGVSKEFFDTIYTNKTVNLSFACAGFKDSSYKQHFHRIPLEEKEFTAEQIIKSALIYSKIKSLFFHK